MKVIRNRILPFGRRYYAINLCGVLFAKGPVNERILNHERIHTAQMLEMAVVFFYLWYLVEWLVRLIQYRNAFKAYRNISFEREAYDNELDAGYLKRRKFWGSLGKLKVKKIKN